MGEFFSLPCVAPASQARGQFASVGEIWHFFCIWTKKSSVSTRHFTVLAKRWQIKFFWGILLLRQNKDVVMPLEPFATLKWGMVMAIGPAIKNWKGKGHNKKQLKHIYLLKGYGVVSISSKNGLCRKAKPRSCPRNCIFTGCSCDHSFLMCLCCALQRLSHAKSQKKSDCPRIWATHKEFKLEAAFKG